MTDTFRCARCNSERPTTYLVTLCVSCSGALASPSPSPSSAPRAEVSRILGELAGFASLCWDPKPTGVFTAEVLANEVERAVERLAAAPASPQPTGARLPSGRLAEPDALREIRRRYTGHGVIHALAALLDAANNLAPEDDPDKYDGWRRLVASARAEYDELWKVAASPQGERATCDRCVSYIRERDEALSACERAQGERERALEDHDLAPVAVEAMVRARAIEECAAECERIAADLDTRAEMLRAEDRNVLAEHRAQEAERVRYVRDRIAALAAAPASPQGERERALRLRDVLEKIACANFTRLIDAEAAAQDALIADDAASSPHYPESGG